MSDDFLSDSRTDAAVLADLGRQLEQVRLAGDLTQRDVAERAGLSKRTLERIEAGESTTTVNLVRLMRALGLLGTLDQIAPAAGPSPWEALRHAPRERRRASGQPAPWAHRPGMASPPADTFRWGDKPGESP